MNHSVFLVQFYMNAQPVTLSIISDSSQDMERHIRNTYNIAESNTLHRLNIDTIPDKSFQEITEFFISRNLR